MNKLFKQKLKLCLLLVISFAFTALKAQTVGLITHLPGSDDDGYVLFAPDQSDSTFLIDKCGKLVHSWGTTCIPGMSVYLLPDGTLLRTGNVANFLFNHLGTGAGSFGGLVQRFDWDGNLLWQYTLSDGVETQNHDICYLPNGNIILAVWEQISVAAAESLGRKPTLLNGLLVCAKLVEIQPVGTDSANIVWTWRLLDHTIQDYDSTKSNYGVVADHPELVDINFVDSIYAISNLKDWTHLNAVTYNPILKQVMISPRNMSEVWILDHTTDTISAAGHTGGIYNKGGDLLYRWGNPRVYRHGNAGNTKFFKPHNPTWIQQGTYQNQIMIFNNGNGRTGGNYSSVDIFAPPVDSTGVYAYDPVAGYGPSSLSWTYHNAVPSNFLSMVEGGTQALPNGNALVCEATKGRFFEVDSLGNTVWKYINPISVNNRVTQGTAITYNSTFRCTFYPSSYSGFSGHILVAGDPIELSPLTYTCSVPTQLEKPVVLENDLRVYPNPTGDLVNIKAANIKTITVKNIVGSLVYSKSFNSVEECTLNCNNFPEGVYLVCLNNQQYTKLVVRH